MTPVDRALAVVRDGGIIGLPTETVYGLAGDASRHDTVLRIFAAKDRPADHPLIVHVAAADQLAHWGRELSSAAVLLAERCWPGPLTLLVAKADHVLPVVTGGRDTIGIRVPAHPLAQEVLQRFGGGLAAPSANRFGHVSPTTAEHVRLDLGDRVDYVLDGGPCPIGIESTIVDCSQSRPQILRPGAITEEEIAQLLDGDLAAASGPSRASGMLASHYAPNCRVHITESPAEADRVAAALEVGGGVVDTLDARTNLAAVARDLYHLLRQADARGLTDLVAILPVAAGLGHAIRDRLSKAAGAR